MAGSDSSHGVSRVVHHKDYYLRGGDLTVLVENHLYRIHSYFFDRESLFFRQKFNGSNNVGESEVGSTDSNAYTLEDVKSEDFARFLWVFYNPKYSVYEAPLDTWLSILKLANRWAFDNVKELSVRELEKIEIEAVEKIAIYHDNNISRLHLIPSYINICKRDKPLSFKEGMSLGMETVLRVAEARERLRLQASESGIRTPTFEDFEDAEVETLIREIFQLGSRPTSPSPLTSPSNGINGAFNGPGIKLNPAPSGNPKANGGPTPRANGGSAADHRSASVDPMPSIASVISRQESATVAPAPAMQASTVAARTSTAATQASTAATQAPLAATQATAASGEPRAPVPPIKPAQAASPSPLVPAMSTPAMAKDHKETPGARDSPKPGGVGEPLSSVDSSQACYHDVKTVVPPSEHSNDVTADSNDNVNDAEKDESGKDNDIASVHSDAEGVKTGKQGWKNKRNRGGKKN